MDVTMHAQTFVAFHMVQHPLSMSNASPEGCARSIPYGV